MSGGFPPAPHKTRSSWSWVSCPSVEQLIRHLTAPDSFISEQRCHVQSACVTHTRVAPSFVWGVFRVTFTTPHHTVERNPVLYIGGFELGSRPLQQQMGYRIHHEDANPLHYHCPLRFLDYAPETAPLWRQVVRYHHSHPDVPLADLRRLHRTLIKESNQ